MRSLSLNFISFTVDLNLGTQEAVTILNRLLIYKIRIVIIIL
jgi:hypothetical protein